MLRITRGLGLLTAILVVCWGLTSILDAQSITPRQILVDRIAESSNGQVLAVTYNDYSIGNLVDFFDGATGTLLSTVDLAPHTPLLIDLSPTGDRLLWADGSSNIGIYDRNSDTNDIIIRGGPFLLEDIAWSPFDNIISWAQGTGVTLWDMSSMTNLGSIISDAQTVVSFAWSPDGQKIATSHYADDILNPGHDLKTIQVWDVSTISPIMTSPILTINDKGGSTIAWSPDGTRVAALESDGILLYDLTTNTPNQTEFSVAGSAMEWSPDSRQLATGGATIRIWDANTWQTVREISVASGVSSLQWSASGEQIFNNGGGDGLYLDDMPLSNLPLTPEANT